MSSSKPRISDVDLKEVEFSVVFMGKPYSIRAIISCYGDFLVYSIDLAMLSTGSGDDAAYKHFSKICKRCIALQHKNFKLRDHFEVM